MNNSPFISVVIPAYNMAQWIAETLESVLVQDFRDFEIIVVDDGSTDGTTQVVAGYGGRISCIRKQNGGTASARNLGIRAARGEFIAFLDADDLWEKEKLRLQVDLIKKKGLSWVYCDAFAFDDNNGKRLYRFSNVYHQYDGDVLKTLFLADFIPSPTPIVCRSVFENVGFFDEDKAVSISEDWDMWLKIASRYPVGLVPIPLAHYRVHPSSKLSSEGEQVFLQGNLCIIERAVAREPIRLDPLKNRRMANCYAQVAGIYAQKQRWTEAKKMYVQAMRISPGLLKVYAGWAACFYGGRLWHSAYNLRRLLFWRS